MEAAESCEPCMRAVRQYMYGAADFEEGTARASPSYFNVRGFSVLSNGFIAKLCAKWKVDVGVACLLFLQLQ